MLSTYRELYTGEIDTTELDAHLEECAACREVLASYTQLGEQMRTVPVIASSKDMHAKLMSALADEQLKFLKKSAPGQDSTPEFLKPYLQQKEATQHKKALADFSTAETGPLPFIPARHRRRRKASNQFAVLGLAAAVLIMFMFGGLISLVMPARNNPNSISKNTVSLARSVEVEQKLSTDNTLYPNVVSSIPYKNFVYFTAYGNGTNNDGWMLLQFDRTTSTSKQLLSVPSNDTLVVLEASDDWVIWLDYTQPPRLSHNDEQGQSLSEERSWTLNALPLNSQSLTSEPEPTTNKLALYYGQPQTQLNFPAPTVLAQGVFANIPDWVTTPIQGTLLTSDSLLVAQIDQQGISHLKRYTLGQTGKLAEGQEIATGAEGHVLAWPTANAAGLLYWADEWMEDNGTLQGNIWQQQTSTQLVRYHGHVIEQSSSVNEQYTTDNLSFHPQIVDDTLFLLSTSEVEATGPNLVKPNGIPLPASATNTSVQPTSRTNSNIYPLPVDTMLHGSVFMIPQSGIDTTHETMLGTVGQSTGFQAGSSYVIWQDDTGYNMYDVPRQSSVILGDTLNNASMLVVQGDTALWFPENNAGSNATGLNMLTFSWSN